MYKSINEVLRSQHCSWAYFVCPKDVTSDFTRASALNLKHFRDCRSVDITASETGLPNKYPIN